jgi:GNAT superfamily N-acetyltransferase
MLQPNTCYVLDDGNGRAVGYILGVSDTPSFVQKWKEWYIPYLQSQGLERPGSGEPTWWKKNLPNALRQMMHDPEAMLHQNQPQLMKEWPAHLHIDVLPPFQRRGYGRQLVERFFQAAREEGVQGVHLLMAASNTEAGHFYTRMGFERFPQVLDNGVSSEKGRDKNTIWLVKTL